jgi:hypothetical protein
MAGITLPAPVKLFLVTLHQDEALLNEAIGKFSESWGEADFESEDFPFEETDYYQKEMGGGLKRRFYSFSKLILPDQIVDAKLQSNRIEEELAKDGSRQVNLDPGYLDTYKVVLASAKFGGQKIYMRDGIYADMTLTMYKGKWEAFLWGFPDFKSRKYDEVLNKIRDIYKGQLRGLREE